MTPDPAYRTRIGWGEVVPPLIGLVVVPIGYFAMIRFVAGDETDRLAIAIIAGALALWYIVDLLLSVRRVLANPRPARSAPRLPVHAAETRSMAEPVTVRAWTDALERHGLVGSANAVLVQLEREDDGTGPYDVLLAAGNAVEEGLTTGRLRRCHVRIEAHERSYRDAVQRVAASLQRLVDVEVFDFDPSGMMTLRVDGGEVVVPVTVEGKWLSLEWLDAIDRKLRERHDMRLCVMPVDEDIYVFPLPESDLSALRQAFPISFGPPS